MLRVDGVIYVISDLFPQINRSTGTKYVNFKGEVNNFAKGNRYIIEINAKDKMAERAIKHIKQGQTLFITGFPVVDTFTDKNNLKKGLLKISLHSFEIIEILKNN